MLNLILGFLIFGSLTYLFWLYILAQKLTDARLKRIEHETEQLCNLMDILMRVQKLTGTKLKKTEDQIRQLFTLTDIISEVQFAPVRLLYAQVRNTPPDKVPNNKKDMLIAYKDSIMHKFIESRDILYAVKEEDPLEKGVREKTLLELESVITLLSSLDKDASEQYIEDVLENMAVSLDKIVGLQDGDY